MPNPDNNNATSRIKQIAALETKLTATFGEQKIFQYQKSVANDNYADQMFDSFNYGIDTCQNILSLLKLYGADFNKKSKYGSTLLSLALSTIPQLAPPVSELLQAPHKYQQVFEDLVAMENLIWFLLENGANPNLKDRYGDTALHGPFANISVNFLQHLYTRGFFSCSYPHILKIFINHGFDINTPDQNGNTLLHLSAQKNDGIAIDASLENGANFHLGNYVKKSMFDPRHDFTPSQTAYEVACKADNKLAINKLFNLHANARLEPFNKKSLLKKLSKQLYKVIPDAKEFPITHKEKKQIASIPYTTSTFFYKNDLEKTKSKINEQKQAAQDKLVANHIRVIEEMKTHISNKR